MIDALIKIVSKIITWFGERSIKRDAKMLSDILRRRGERRMREEYRRRRRNEKGTGKRNLP